MIHETKFMGHFTPQSQVQPSQAEILLFNDIMADKTSDLRNVLTDYLQIYTFRSFELEFSNFLNHLRNQIVDTHRAVNSNLLPTSETYLGKEIQKSKHKSSKSQISINNNLNLKLENMGFKIDLGLPVDYKYITNNVEQYLTMWTINRIKIKSSNVIVKLTGN